MISSMSATVFTLYEAITATLGTIFRGGVPSLMPSFEGNPAAGARNFVRINYDLEAAI